MKTYNRLSWFLIIIVLVANTGCKKHSLGTTTTYYSFTSTNTAPKAYAGLDFLVWSPNNMAQLNGSYRDDDNNIKEVSWAKISGPNSCIIENKNSLETRISGLEKGVYQFELTVTDNMNLYDKDTMAVTVGEIRDNSTELIFKDLVWINPWYNNVVIEDFVSIVPPGSMFKIFIQRGNDPAWKEVPPQTASGSLNGLYDYFIITRLHDFYVKGSLYISYYGSDIDDTPNVKIIF